jgi:hypothetical protein
LDQDPDLGELLSLCSLVLWIGELRGCLVEMIVNAHPPERRAPAVMIARLIACNHKGPGQEWATRIIPVERPKQRNKGLLSNIVGLDLIANLM